MSTRTINLRCPKCQKSKVVKRESSDPVSAVRVDIQCPECNGGDFDTPHFYGKNGQHIAPYQPNEVQS